MKLIASHAHSTAGTDPGIVSLGNDIDPRSLNLQGVRRVDLNFPKFTDGRAYSQAYLLRQRMRFAGEIRATGDVLIDQLLQMKRSGFDAAVLRSDQDPGQAARQFDYFPAFYQGDGGGAKPPFANATAT